MAETIKSKLTDNQIKFMSYWEKNVLTNKNRISPGMLDQASNYIGKARTGNCSTCMRNDALELNNLYRGLLNLYEEYKKELKELQKVVEKTKEEIKKDFSKIEKTIKKKK